MATVLSILAGVIVALVSLLESARVAAEQKLIELGGQIRSHFSKYDFYYWLSMPDSANALFQHYRFANPGCDAGSLLWQMAADLNAGRSLDTTIDLESLVPHDASGQAQYGLMVVHLAEYALGELDPSAAERRFDVVNHSPAYAAVRAYRARLFPIDVLGLARWMSVFSAFERIVSTFRHRHAQMIPQVVTLRAFPPAYVAQRLDETAQLAQAVSPLAHQADAVSREVVRLSTMLRMACSPVLGGALLLALVAGVATPLFVLLAPAPMPLSATAVYAWSTLLVSVVATGYISWRLTTMVLTASGGRKSEQPIEVLRLRERFFPRWDDGQLMLDIDLPMTSTNAAATGAPELAMLLREYEEAARAIFCPGLALRDVLANLFTSSGLQRDYPPRPNAGSIAFGITSLSTPEALGAVLAANQAGADLQFWAGEYGVQNRVLATFQWPAAGPDRNDVVTRLASLVISLHGTQAYKDWLALIGPAMAKRTALVAFLQKV